MLRIITAAAAAVVACSADPPLRTPPPPDASAPDAITMIDASASDAQALLDAAAHDATAPDAAPMMMCTETPGQPTPCGCLSDRCCGTLGTCNARDLTCMATASGLFTYTCMACGANGEPCCGASESAPANTRTCNPGLRCRQITTQNTCGTRPDLPGCWECADASCGQQGQPCCLMNPLLCDVGMTCAFNDAGGGICQF